VSKVSKETRLDKVERGYLNQYAKALSNASVLVVSPATLGSSAAVVNGGGFTRNVAIELQDVDGTLHDWFDGTFTVAIADTSTGTATIPSTTATFINGRVVITITYTGTWAAADTCTLTITGGTKLGYTVSNKTSVDTLIA
jgi:hypothetical protein